MLSLDNPSNCSYFHSSVKWL